MTEKQITAAVLAHWRALGVPGSLVASIPNAGSFGQPGLTRGLFDLLVIGGTVGIAFLELKTDRGIVSGDQLAFSDTLRAAGIEHAITYGRDAPIAALERWGIVRPRTTGATP